MIIGMIKPRGGEPSVPAGLGCAEHQIEHLVLTGGLPRGLPQADVGVGRDRDALALPYGSGHAQAGRPMNSLIAD